MTNPYLNALVIEVGGYVDSKGNFEFRGRTQIDIYLGPLHLYAGMSVLFSSQPRFAAAAWGGIDFELDFGLFSISFTIAAFRAEIDITPASASLDPKARMNPTTTRYSTMVGKGM